MRKHTHSFIHQTSHRRLHIARPVVEQLLAVLLWVASMNGLCAFGTEPVTAFPEDEPRPPAAEVQEPEATSSAEGPADLTDTFDDIGGFGDAGNLQAPALNVGGNLAGFGVAAGSFSAAPTMTGDIFGGGVSHLSMDAQVEPLTVAGPDVASRRAKLSENFSPVARDRCYINYSFFNDAFGGLGDVSRWVLGFERACFDDLISFEVRQPMAATFGSRQEIDDPGDRSYELGNMTVLSKFVLWRQHDLVWSAGLGATLPLADDAKLTRGDEPLLVIRNQSVHLLPYTGVLLRQDQDTAFQGFVQFDFDANGNDVRGDIAGGPLPKLGTFNDAALIMLDASFHQTLYRQQRWSGLREVIGNAELHYTGTLQESDVVTGPGLTITNLSRNFNVLNATLSSHLLFGAQLVVTPGISVPMRDGLDEQFDYEAILQVNYLR